MNYKDIILKTIDLQNYSKSKNWIGYFERNVPYSFKFIEKTIDIFLNFFDINDFIIATSQYIDVANINSDLYMESIVEEIEKEFIDKKYINLIQCEYLQNDNDILKGLA